jgi:four helix bundle protein
MAHPLPSRTPTVQRYEDLVCWRLANELKVNVYALTEKSRARLDRSFCDQIKDSAASAPANLSAAFGWFRHGAAARHARIARASLFETKNHLGDGVDRKFWTSAESENLQRLANRAIAATTGWLEYLCQSEEPDWPENPDDE